MLTKPSASSVFCRQFWDLTNFSRKTTSSFILPSIFVVSFITRTLSAVALSFCLCLDVDDFGLSFRADDSRLFIDECSSSTVDF